MAKLVECPFCKTNVGETRLARHVVEQHMEKGHGVFAYFCWCGGWG